ncbi:MAG: LCP family protein [Candidatus Gastranaerophilales bacterium]|nr:LCP family protein [Candidatus Gastranaerophilales bacterium]
MSRDNNMNSSLDDRMQVYRIPIRPQYKRRRRPKKQNNFPRFLLFLAVIVGCIFYFVNHKIESDTSAPVASSSRSPIDFNFNFSPRTQNILVLGVDSASNEDNPFRGNRSDTILLVSVAPYGKNINVISIPRDSKVYISGKNKTDKINHAFSQGGAKLAVKTVEETFGVKIHNYLAISNAGVIKAIDILGGLPIYVEKDMKYNDYTAKLHINLKQGNHILTGKQVEGYLRFRHDSFGDIGRIRRQQWFFDALSSHLKNPVTVVKLPELLKVIPDYIQTDLSAYDLTKYLGMAKNIDSSSIQIATIPGAPSTKGVISYWIIEPEKTQELINKMVYRNKTNFDTKDLSIGILYATSSFDSATMIKDELESKGLTVKMQASDNVSKNYIAIHNLDVAGDVISELKKTIPEIKDKHTIYDPIGINRTGRDMTIVVSDL